MEKEEVIQSIKNLFAGADERNWQKIRDAMSGSVLLDYTSMSGGTPTTMTPEQITNAWALFLPGFDRTDHQLSDFKVATQGNVANVHYHGKASHFIGRQEWIVEGTYDSELTKESSHWVVIKHKFNFTKQGGNTNLPAIASKKMQTIKSGIMKRIEFNSEGLTLAGNLFFPPDFDETETYPAVVVSGSWTTVKEQMAGLYAERLSKEGFITLAFDFRNYGESEGQPRFFESPALKSADIKNAVTFLSSHPQIDRERLGALGICAGAMYTLMAAADDSRIKAVTTVASWLHDAEAVKLFYGGESGVQNKINAGLKSKKKFAETGVVDYVPSISETDPNAAMYGPYDYYLNPERGAIPQWSADKFAVMSWVDWLTTDPMYSAKKLTAPTLMIHSDGAVLPQYTRNYFNNIAASEKKLHWMKTDLQSPFHQFNFYDQEGEVSESLSEMAKWFKAKLSLADIQH